MTSKNILNRNMNILFIIRKFPVVSETFIYNQIYFLLDQGHNVKILALSENDSPMHPLMKKYDFKNRVVYYRIPKNKVFKILEALNILFFNLDRSKHFKKISISRMFLLKTIKNFKEAFDIVHCHYGFTSKIYFEANKIGLLTNSKLITSFHGYDMKKSEVLKNKLKYDELFKSNPCLITNNNYGKNQLRLLNKKLKNINLLPVGVDTTYFKPSLKKADVKAKFIVLFCGNLIPLKGPHIVVEIANKIIHDFGITDVEFIIIGDGPQRLIVDNLINKYHLEDFVFLKGKLNQDEVISEMDNADIFLLPGITDDSGTVENQGLVIQEAQSMKLPVLVSNAGGMKFGLLDGISGYVLPEGEVKEFVSKIIFLKENVEFRLQMGNKGRELIMNDFDTKVLGEKLLSIYNNSISSKQI